MWFTHGGAIDFGQAMLQAGRLGEAHSCRFSQIWNVKFMIQFVFVYYRQKYDLSNNMTTEFACCSSIEVRPTPTSPVRPPSRPLLPGSTCRIRHATSKYMADSNAAHPRLSCYYIICWFFFHPTIFRVVLVHWASGVWSIKASWVVLLTTKKEVYL